MHCNYQNVSEQNEELQFQMILSLTEAEMNATVIKRECNEKNNLVWPLLVVKVVTEMLVNGTALHAVAKNIESTVRSTCPTVAIEELP